jgi:VWFA-related protein
VILHRSRFVLVAGLVAFAAFLFGLGTFLRGAQPASRPRPPVRPGTAQRSGDDGGFSVTLTEPSESYLVGVKRIVIEPRVPPGDTVVGADFFVDGRLVATDRRPPYSTEIDFGQEIRRHTIIVTALTAGGRRAKVSFVSRAGDLAGGAAEPLALVPAVVRDAGGRFVDGLSVADFVLLENGARLPIVHFDDNPVPQSIAVAIEARAPEEARGVLLRGAVSFSDSLLSFDSLGLVAVASLSHDEAPARADAPRPERKRKEASGATEAAPLPAVEFSYDHGLFTQRLSELDDQSEGRGGEPLAEALQIATRGLVARPRGRVLLALLAGTGPREAAAAMAAIEPDAAGGATAPAPRDATAPAAAEDLKAALDAVKRSGATLHVVVYGGAESFPFPEIKKAAEETGGEFLVAASREAVEEACRRISQSLQHQYLVSFAPVSPEREGWRSIEVRLRPPDLAVQARRTYFASQPPKRP